MTSSENRQTATLSSVISSSLSSSVTRIPSFQLAPSSTSAIGRAERASDRSDPWSLRPGPDRCDRAFPMRSLLESGAEVALVSDFPVARFDPREGLAATCVRRRSCSAQAPDEEQGCERARRFARFHDMGSGGRRGEGRADGRGGGGPHDLWGHPSRVPGRRFDDNPVLLTVVGGGIVRRAI